LSELAAPGKVELHRAVAGIQDEQDDRTVGILKRDVFQAALTKRVGFDPPRAWLDEFAGMAKRRVIDSSSRRAAVQAMLRLSPQAHVGY
jgi:hypothetical protein